MTPLDKIETFPAAIRQLLEKQYGLNTAEAFYEMAVRNPMGLQTAIKVSPDELTQLEALTKQALSKAFVKKCHQPVTKHARGVIVDN